MTITNTKQLVNHINSGNTVKYLLFWGHTKPKYGVTKSCFSQWYETPFDHDGNHFPTAEHFMMYHKAKLFGDNEAAEQVLTVQKPGKVKAIGRRVKGFNEAKWEANKFDIVVEANLAKFGSNPELKTFLLETGDRILVEASPVDKIWGIGLAQDNPAAQDPKQWQGENLLGFALMKVRQML